MCGIAGLVFSSYKTVDPQLVQQLSSKLQHRGPDDFGVLLSCPDGIQKYRSFLEPKDAELVLIHQRLSILDLSEAGWQPMSSEDSRFHITFNGEIYNYLELRSQLEQKGYTFKTQSDTEVLLNAYIHWRSDCLNKLVGMFSFAILDSYEQKLFIARDFFGIKPLYYCVWDDNFAFASEIPPLLEITGITRKVNSQKIYEYLVFNRTDQGKETLFKDISQIPPAHYVEINIKSPHRVVEAKRFWKIDSSRKVDLSFRDASQKLRELFLNSINLHLRSDVSIGTALSGGIDSSSIVSAIRYLDPDITINTFSYIADSPELSEEYYIDQVATATRSLQHKIKTDAIDLINDIEKLICIQGEPFNSTSIYAQYRVFAAAQKAGIKVMLDGQGADEFLAGYFPYKGAYLASLISQKHWRKALLFWRQVSKDTAYNSSALEKCTVDSLLPNRLKVLARRFAGNGIAPSYLNMSWFHEHDVKPVMASLCDVGSKLKQAQLYSISEHGLPRLLRYEDRNSMAFSIESRVPFLTPEITSFVMSLPEEFLIDSSGTSKAIFRSAMRGIVPDGVLDRRDKIGFATPERQWLRNDLDVWSQSILKQAHSIPFLDLTSGREPYGEKVKQSSLWKVINLIVWSKLFEVEYT